MPVPVACQQYNLCICVETHVSCSGFHAKCTSNWMLKFCEKILQYYYYSIHLKDWLLVEEISTWE